MELSDFPPKLRKLANTIIETIQIKTLKEYCELSDVNYCSVTTLISRYRKKGIDFNVYLNNQYRKFLDSNKLDVTKSLVEGAIAGTSADKKLYFQLTGDLIERQKHKHTHAVIVASPMSTTPPKDIIKREEEEKKKAEETIMDVEVIK